MPIMRYGRTLPAGFASAVGLILLSGWSASSSAQTAAAATASQANPPGLQCNTKAGRDPFEGKLAGPDLPAGLLPVDDKDKSSILNSGLPCQEHVSPTARDNASDEGV